MASIEQQIQEIIDNLVDIVSLSEYKKIELKQLFTDEEKRKLLEIRDQIRILQRDNLKLKEEYNKLKGDKSHFDELFFSIAKLQILTIKNLLEKNRMKRVIEQLEASQETQNRTITGLRTENTRFRRDLEEDEARRIEEARRRERPQISRKTKDLYNNLVRDCSTTRRGDIGYESCKRTARLLLERRDVTDKMRRVARIVLSK